MWPLPITPDYNPTMDTTEIIQTIDAEIDRLEKARALLNGNTISPAKHRRPSGSDHASLEQATQEDKREGRARIAAAQKARWAKAKK